ncbi:radical SAM protein [uncultured Arcticibacterium sp.]|mgnify:CR=1 FL=1|uniref:B12-binding domain-containing radical SAM protein n=1 Tax=uncultured Arcticibacterium sp. TaxID=2173042 RepID=UPI0030F6BA64
MNKVIIFNPRATNSKPRLPITILQVGVSIWGQYDFVLVDGNREDDPFSIIESYIKTGKFKYFACTVMPGPQLKQAITFTKKIREQFPEIITIWGGYFASNQHQVCIESEAVDYLVNGVGDIAFPALLDALEAGGSLKKIKNLVYMEDGKIIKTPKVTMIDIEAIPRLPYTFLEKFYSMDGYIGKTHLGKRTTQYHSSLGCPFTCSFCGIVPIFQARWKGKSAEVMFADIMYQKEKYQIDSVEFTDNNFFVSEKRVLEFSKLMKGQKINWWGEGRIDTMDKFSDETMSLLRDSGCKMIFLGAESGNDELLNEIDKGGTQTGDQMLTFAKRMKDFDIIPEYSFVLGFPGDSSEKVMEQIDSEILYIKKIKEVNPDTEIIIYVYSPVPQEGSEMYEKVKDSGFRFPETLDDWLDDSWQNFDLRKNPLTPWLTAAMIDKIQNFEVVLNARYPTTQDIKLSDFQRNLIAKLANIRYKTNFYKAPYELKALQKFWLKYRQPEIEGAELI